MICTMQFKGEVAAVCPDMDGAGRDSIQADLYEGRQRTKRLDFSYEFGLWIWTSATELNFRVGLDT